MLREIVKIDEELCDGCGICIPSCHEGALQIVDGKARLVSDLMCDGLGACLNECPHGAISIEQREAEPYNESKVMEAMVKKGENTVIAHMKHLKEHGELSFLREAVNFLRNNEHEIDFSIDTVIDKVHTSRTKNNDQKLKIDVNNIQLQNHGGCPGAQERSFKPENNTTENETISGQSELRQWPVQMHLINPAAPYFRKSDLLLAADCVAFSIGNFHQKYLKGKSLAIACPKLDSNMEVYVQKITSMIDHAKVNTITVLIMQVPCCGGLLQMTKRAAQNAERKVPIKLMVAGIEGDILKEVWV